MGRRRRAVAALAAAFVAAVAASPVAAQDVRLPVLVPLTGFVALEGTSQRHGALLAAQQARDVAFKPDVLDTQATPEAAVTAWERALGDLGAFQKPPVVFGPAVPVGGDPVPVVPASLSPVEGALRNLWDPSSGRVTRFPVSTDTTMEVCPERIVIARSAQPLSTLSLPAGDGCFTDALALDVGTLPFVVAGTDRGNVLLARADSPYAGSTAQMVPTDGPVSRMGLLEDGRVVVEGAHGTSLVLELPTQPGETVRAGGEKAAPSDVQGKDEAPPGTIETEGDSVIVGGVRIPRRHLPLLLAR